MSGSLDGRAAKARAKSRVIELEKLGERRIGGLFPDGESRLARSLRELVPGASGETVVAAENAIAHGLAELRRDVTLMLDGEVGDAAARIDLIGRRERARRADVETPSAAAAMILFRLVRRNHGRREDRADEEPGAEFARDKVRVLSLPAETCRGGKRLLHDGGGVDEHLHLSFRQGLDGAGKRFELRLEHAVIVGALRIDRDCPARALAENSERIAGRTIVEAEHDDALRLRPKRPWALAPVGSRCEPVHVAVPALGEERGKGGTRSSI